MNIEDLLSDALAKADAGITKLPPEVLAIESQVGPNTRMLLNNLVTPETVYLEIGMRWGGSFVSALHGNNPVYACGIEILWPGMEDQMREAILGNVSKYLVPAESARREILFADCWKVDLSRFARKFNLFLYDGDHSEEAHMKALSLYWDVLDDDFIFVCDDWNWDDVRAGTAKGFLAKQAHVISQNVLEDMAKWYNGLFLAHVAKRHLL